MKKTVNFLFLMFLFFFNALNADEKRIKIAIIDDMIPYTFYDENVQPSGLFVDYWKLWSKKTGIRIEFVPMQWNESIKAIKDGRIDIHSGLFINKPREEFLDFSQRIYISQSHIYASDMNKKVNSIDELNGYTIGLLSDTYFEFFMKKNYPKIKVKAYKTLDDLFIAVKNKRVDFFIDDSLIVWFQLIKNFSFNKVNLLPGFQLSKWFHAGVKKGNSDLLEAINIGMNKISIDEIIKIERKWIVENSFRYFEQKRNIDLLTYEERIWLLNNPDIQIAVVKDWEKYSILNKKGEVEGFHVDLINQINKNLNTNLKIKVYENWSEAYDSVKAGKSHAIPGLSWSKQREKEFIYSPSYHYSPYYIITNKDNNSIKSKKDFENKIAATFENSITNQIVKEEASNIKIIHVKAIREILEKLQKNEVDFALIENAKVIDLNKYNVKIVDSFFSKYSEISIGTSNKYDILANIIKQGMNSISQSQMTILKDEWLNKKNIFSKKEQFFIENSEPFVVGVEDWTAIIGMNENKEIEGIGGEIVKKAFDISGLKFKFVKGEWDVLLQDFKDGKIDILPTTLYTKQRDEYGDFTEQYLPLKNFIYVRNDNKEIKSLKDLNNKKIALQRDFATITLIKEKFPLIEIIETQNLEESISKVLNGEVDALFELQVSVENKMREFLITNLKAISQNSFKTQSLHIFIQENQEVLKSILNKSLSTIPGIVKNQIISKWINTFTSKDEVDISFTKQIPPFVIKKEHIKGMDYDIVEKVLGIGKVSIKNSKEISYQRLNSYLSEDNSTDIAVGIRKKDKTFFYSDNLLPFNDIAITRIKDDYIIDDYYDLFDKKVLAYSNAHKYLGKEFVSLFNEKTRPKNYSEIVNQKIQVQEFLDGKVDVIILDEKIFKWYLKKLSNKNIDEFKFHDIFTVKIPRYVAFKDKKLRDLFNRNLKKIKRSGEYDLIIEDYTKDLITSKIKVNSLISEVLGKYIHLEEIESLNKLVTTFSSMPYIEKIEVFNNDNELISSNKRNGLKYFNAYDSYHFIEKMPKKVGSIKVYYRNNILEKYENFDLILPHLDLFKDFYDYEHIKSVYKRLDYINEKIILTNEELKFLDKKKVFKFSTSHWEPVAIVNKEQGSYDGLIADYLKLIEKDTGIKFEYVYSPNWLSVLDKFNKKEIDFIPGIGNVGLNLEDVILSNKITEFKFAIVSKKEQGFIEGLDSLKGLRIAAPKGYTSYKLLKNSTYDFNIIEARDEKDAFRLVANGNADVLITHSAVAVYNIKNNFPDLKIVGLTGEKFAHHIAVQSKYPELLSIINKAIYNITAKQKQDIKYRWVQTEVSTAVDYSLVYKIIFGFLIIIVIVLFYNRKLSSAKVEIEDRNIALRDIVKKLKLTQEALLDKTKDLEEQKSIFETLFNDTSDGLALIKDGKFIACNNATLQMLKCKTKEQFLSLRPEEISPDKQPCGYLSKEKSDIYLEECIENGKNRFEWIHKDFNQEEFWVEVVLTKIILNHEDVIHVVWRDIKDKKILEEQNLKRTMELEDANLELEMSLNNLKQTQNQLIESEKMASLGGLVAGVAHEINTPIGIGLTGTSHFQEITNDIKKSYDVDRMTQEEFEEYLKTSGELAHLINVNLKKAANLVKSFKQVAVDQTSEEKRVFNLNEYIHEVLSSIYSVTKKTKLDIEVICDSNLKINSYPGDFSQILTNLIMNSILHGYEKEEEGLLTIEAKKEEDELKLIYRDDGKGIPEENLNKIFDPFFTTNRENGGSGLGLNIIYNIVNSRLNGKIKCNSQGKGVEFIVTVKV